MGYWYDNFIKHDALEKAEESNRELLEHIESLQKIAYEQPVIIPVETAYTDNVVVYPVSSMTLQQRVNMLYSNKKL